MKTYGRTLLLVIVLSIALGAIGGFLGAKFRLPPPVIWTVFGPTLFLFLYPLLNRRRSATDEEAAGVEVVLLEASNTGGRIVQTLLPVIGALLSTGGVAMMVRADGGVSTVSVSMAIAGIALIVLSLRCVIGWDVSYKGHTVRFENDACTGERLYIDGKLVARGGVGFRMVLSGKIAGGDGAGDTIRAVSHAGLPTLRCRIVALRQ
jgi:hypothetical protein